MVRLTIQRSGIPQQFHFVIYVIERVCLRIKQTIASAVRLPLTPPQWALLTLGPLDLLRDLDLPQVNIVHFLQTEKHVLPIKVKALMGYVQVAILIPDNGPIENYGIRGHADLFRYLFPEKLSALIDLDCHLRESDLGPDMIFLMQIKRNNL